MNNWSNRENLTLVFLRLWVHGRELKFNRLRADDLDVWKIIARNVVLWHGRKSAMMCRDRFFEILEDYLIYFNMSNVGRMMAGRPLFADDFDVYMSRCHAAQSN